MKATLYAVQLGALWEWRATLAMIVDCEFWFREQVERGRLEGGGQRGHRGKQVQRVDQGCQEDQGCHVDEEINRFRGDDVAIGNDLLIVEPPLSWGQAVWLKDYLNKEEGVCYKWDDLTLIRNVLIKGLVVVQASPRLLELVNVKLESLKSMEHWETYQNYKFVSATIPVGGMKTRASVEYLEVSRSIQFIMGGRSLLQEEFLNLLTQGAEGSLAHLHKNWREVVQSAYLTGHIHLTQGVTLTVKKSFWNRKRVVCCQRCGSGEERMYWTECLFCGGPCPYCEECITMGRSRFCSLLIQGGVIHNEQVIISEEMMNDIPSRQSASLVDTIPIVSLNSIRHWGLSPAQTDASLAGLRFLERTSVSVQETQQVTRQATLPSPSAVTPPRFLIWAVTGAGKTEMIYPFLEHELSCGRNVLITTPRRDVLLELLPRLQVAFPTRSVIALYGGSGQRWERGDLVIATTHQLMRFKHAFDLVIIDELDAYPFHNNPMLEFAAAQVCKPNGRYIFLSATPPLELQAEVRRKTLEHVKVPVRYHRYPLPVPKLIRIKPVNLWVVNRQGRPSIIPPPLHKAMLQSLERGAQLFVFVSRIKYIEPLVLLLRVHFKNKVIQGTSSQDEERADKVTGFRQSETNILVTTTILERGVTVPKTDVFILDADAMLFDSASLVQMSGRAGRSKDDPWGRVYFVGRDKTKSQVEAIRQISEMNKLARLKGYLLEKERR